MPEPVQSGIGAQAGRRLLRPEVADVFRVYGPSYRQTHALSAQQARVMRAIEQCRTAALGGHLQVCDRCDYSRPAYNSCRNRHCPKCQNLKQAQGVEARLSRLLPIPYFHVVFTLPAQLRRLCRRNERALYRLLFTSAAETLLQLGADRLGAQLGITAVLHTWTRKLDYHPHLHCIVTAGGLSLDGTRFVHGNPRYLFPVKVLSELFRGKFLAGLRKLASRGKLQLDGADLRALLTGLYQTPWVVYAKRPLGGPAQVFAYLGRYTHRTGISNQRLLFMDPQGVCFSTKGGGRETLCGTEFIRRFLLHVLPPGFVKLRHFGLWASGAAQDKLHLARQHLRTEGVADKETPPVQAPLVHEPVAPVQSVSAVVPAPKDPKEAETPADKILRLCGVDITRCPKCEHGRLKRQPLTSPPTPRSDSDLDTS